MINLYEVTETNKMIEEENLDVRTITLGISLLDCIDSDLQRLNDRIYHKIYDAARDEYYEEEPYRDIEVVDRIGSGDAYIAGALYGLLSSGGDCMKAVRYGNAASALKNTIPGDLPTSDLEEMNMIIREHNQKGPQSEMSR